MKKNYNITIPEYLSIEKYQRLQNLEHLSDIGKLVATIAVFTDIPEEEIKTWALPDLGKVAKDFSTNIDTEKKFYPVWQHEGVNYGYADISTMSLGEFVDLESLCKKPTENLHEIMAVLYRPIDTHKFNSIKWKAQHNVQLMQKKVDNVFKWYKLKKYDNNNRYIDAEVMKQLPAGFALGALSFFLGTANLCSINTLNSLKTIKDREILIKKLNQQTWAALTSIGDGLQQFITSPKQVFSISQEKEVLLS